MLLNLFIKMPDIMLLIIMINMQAWKKVFA